MNRTVLWQSGSLAVGLWLCVVGPVQGLQWETKPTWKAEGQALGAAGPGETWDTLLSRAKRRDGSFSAVVRIAKAADPNRACPAGGGSREFLPGYEAALVFRHAGNKSYRLCLSSVYNEAVLCRDDGRGPPFLDAAYSLATGQVCSSYQLAGCLAVHDAPLAIGADHLVRVDFHGDRIKVFVDGREIMDVTDPHPLLQEGQVGLAVKQGEARFSGIELKPVGPLGAGSPRADFAYRKWHGEDWFFHGLEPIAALLDTNFHLKLAPGTPMMADFPIYWMQYIGPEWYANTKMKWEVRESGRQLKWCIEGMTPKGEILGKYLATIGYDPAAKAFVYDFDAEFTVQPGKTWPNTYLPEFCDFWPYNAVGPAAVPPEQCRHRYGWIVWQGKDDRLYKYPINHNGYMPGMLYGADRLKIKEGGFIGYFNEDLNPVFRILKAQTDVTHALCAWAHDLHLAYVQPKEPMKEGTHYAVRFQLTACDGTKGAEILRSASFPPEAHDLDWEYPYYRAGVNDFQRGVRSASPHQVQVWRKGCVDQAWHAPPDFWDRTVGYKDKTSVRVDGEGTVAAGIGRSWFMPPFAAKRYRISAMVKTENVRGEGPYLGFYCIHNKGCKDRFVAGVTGTRDWTKVSFVTEKLTGIVQGFLMVGLSGTGKAWFDDVEVRALGENETNGQK